MFKQKLIRYLTKHLLKWISQEDLFEVFGGKITHKGKVMSQEQVYQLVEQSKTIKKMYVWKTLSDEIRYTAYIHWLKTGEDLSARMLLRADEIIQKKLDALSNIPVSKVED